MRKTFILDTSVLLYDSQAIHSFPGNDIVLPLVVLEELDKFKERQGLVGQNARYVNRFLDEMRSIDLDDEVKRSVVVVITSMHTGYRQGGHVGCINRRHGWIASHEFLGMRRVIRRRRIGRLERRRYDS